MTFIYPATTRRHQRSSPARTPLCWTQPRCSVVIVCHTNKSAPGHSPVTLAMIESQTSTIGVAGIPLNRDEVTVV